MANFTDLLMLIQNVLGANRESRLLELSTFSRMPRYWGKDANQRREGPLSMKQQ